MQFRGTQLFFSPSDLAHFVSGDFETWMERYFIEHSGTAEATALVGGPALLTLHNIPVSPDIRDDTLELFASEGNAHEKRFLATLTAEGHDVAIIPTADRDDSERLTLEAMRQGYPYIYQAALKKNRFHGTADFLARNPGSSSLGNYHYEVWDTKLARSVKPHFVIQLCSYSDMLAELQGHLPDTFSVVLGTGNTDRRLTRNYIYYYRSLRNRFLDFHDTFSSTAMPHPGRQSYHGRWSTFAEQYLQTQKHISLTAGITKGQVKRLSEAGITTLEQLSSSNILCAPRIQPHVFDRIRSQARLQIASDTKQVPDYELLPADPAKPLRGLAMLPPPSAADVFFDIEGFPLVQDGLEYLLGISTAGPDNSLQYRDWWSHTSIEERNAFQSFIDWIYARWKSDQSMHVYHFAAYEVAALLRLAKRHMTRQQELEDMLDNDVFIDLYKIVRQSLVVGTSRYSLKHLETLYAYSRPENIASSLDSMVAYNQWLQSGEDSDWSSSPLLRDIRSYNMSDCASLFGLARWLRTIQEAAGIQFLGSNIEASIADDNELRASALLATELRSTARGLTGEHKRVIELVADLLEYHWRESKPGKRKFVLRQNMTEAELFDDADCLAGLRRTAALPRHLHDSQHYEYSFDVEQETKLHDKSRCYCADDVSLSATIGAMDLEAGLVELSFSGLCAEAPERLNLIPNDYVPIEPLINAIMRYAESLLDGGCMSSALEDLLYRRKPRIQNHSEGVLLSNDEEPLSAAIDIVRRMKGTTVCIQGPPGCGKTFTSAHAIVALLAAGKKVGVTATSHKVILNLLNAIYEAARTAGIGARIIKAGGDPDDSMNAPSELEFCSTSAAERISKEVGAMVIGGTAWFFARSGCNRAFDYLFIDEAGQFSLANTIATGLSTDNIVLVGDQMQLSQPTQGSHPGESGESVLNYVLSGHATIPLEMGIFLPKTYRLCPSICEFVSSAFYDNRLISDEQSAHNSISPVGRLVSKTSGIICIKLQHHSSSQRCQSEADIVKELVDECLEKHVWDLKLGRLRPLTLDDMLIVTPFNAQLQMLRRTLPSGSRIGTVDKFQGQEGHVVIVSMCSSTLDDAPRGADFLLEPNRINVAISRAKTTAIVVLSEDLLKPNCSSVREIELANGLCWLDQFAEPIS